MRIALTLSQIDHFPHSGRYAPHDAGTFKQRYFFEDKYYKPGGPVFLYIGGEVNAKYRFSNLQTGRGFLDDEKQNENRSN